MGECVRRLIVLSFLAVVGDTGVGPSIQYPQGYYPFQESPARIPPKVRKPPYLQTQVECPGAGQSTRKGTEQTLDNLCGDLNKGFLPVNPIGQTILGVSYPFQLIKNKTLDFFSKTLPILKADDTLPKVAKYQDSHIMYNPTIFNSQPNTKIKFYETQRNGRSQEETVKEESEEVKERIQKRESEVERDRTGREGRGGWCDHSFGVFCMLFNALKGPGDTLGSVTERTDEEESIGDREGEVGPMTPCPSAVEYVTPVFAKNYQGVWRYVVQIPYEGYFTQTVEVVKCLSTKCEFLDGSCLASPRWVSLLVAEIYYPDTYFPSLPGSTPAPGRDPIKASPPSDLAQYLLKRSGAGLPGESTQDCDGQDELGCFHVRLYYDWFLIPGSCKCWKNDFFAQYTRK